MQAGSATPPGAGIAARADGMAVNLAQTPPAAFELAGWRVEPDSGRLTGASGEIRLDAEAMQVLVYLAHNPGRTISLAELEARVWPERIVGEDGVAAAIVALQRAFDDTDREPRVITADPGSGFRLIAPVAPAPDRAERPGARSPPPRSPRRQQLVLTASAVLLSLLTTLLLLLVLPGENRDPRETAGAPVAGKPQVAVLRLEDLSADRDQAHLVHGITADLITDLSRLSGLSVAAAGRDSPGGAAAREPARPLDGGYLLSGDVQRTGERLHVNLRLARAADGSMVWSGRFDAAVVDVFELQDALADAVVGALGVEPLPAERSVLARQPSASAAAYELYLHGVEAFGSRTAAQNRSARARFQRALELDPGFARAYAGLAMSHARDAIDGWTSTPAAALQRAAGFAARAVVLEPALPQVHFAAAQVDLFLGRHDQALRAIDRALLIDPAYADGHVLRARIHLYAGREAQAMSALQTALSLHPAPPAAYLEVLGEIQLAQDRLADATASCRRALEINPDHLRARLWLAAALVRAGADGPAEWETLELAVQNPALSLARIHHGLPYRDSGSRDRLLAALRQAGMRD